MPNFLVHTARDRRRVVSPGSIYHLEAESDDTLIRRRGARRIRDVRELTELTAVLAHHGFLRIHRKHAINPRYILEIRKRKNKQDWELKLAPPVNKVLPIARDYLDALWAHYGER